MIGLSTIVSACTNATDPPPAAIDPFGPAAAEINGLSWLLIGLGSLVYVGVSTFLLLALFRRRQAGHTGEITEIEPSRETVARETVARETAIGHRIVLWGGMVMPVLILLVIAGLTLNTLLALATEPRPDELVIDVTGHQWWWEIAYPGHDIITANEIHIPVGQPVRINLRAEGVVHSFWVPQLHGKLDMIPGRVNTFHIQADSAGEFRGICAEFCGIQHARMLFLVIAQEPAAFGNWLAQQQQPAATAQTASEQAGESFFMQTPCAQCHAIAGTEAAGRLGPDLTHFASRREIGAGTLDNSRSNLADWLINPQTRKSGNLMPATTLSEDELNALLDYLMVLE